MGGIAQDHEVSAGIHLRVVADDGAHCQSKGASDPQHAHGKRGPQHPPPARGRRVAIGKEQENQPEKHECRRPAGLREQRHPAQRQPAMPEPVVGHRVEAGIIAERSEGRQTEDDPAKRVARPPPGNDEPHHREASGNPHRKGGAAGVQALVRQPGQGRSGDRQRHHQAAEDHGRRGRCQPEAARRDLRRHRRLPARWLRLPMDRNATPAPFRERYRSTPHLPSGA
jgi:hypothetical protein